MSIPDAFGARADAPADWHFGDPVRECAAALVETVAVPLAQLAWIEVHGEDAASFLQGQLSNDVRAVDATRAQLSSYNSPKGRLLAVLHVLRDGDRFLLELHARIADAVLRRLRMHVLRSRVALAVADRFGLGLAGPDAASALAQAGLPAPQGALACARAGAAIVMRRLGVMPRFTILTDPRDAAARWPDLVRRARPAGTRAWTLLDIAAGVPTVYPETQDRFVPQMCNLDKLGAISFDKGCYTGQEIVARMHYRGAVKRHIQTVRLADSAPAPGADVVLANGAHAEVVDAAHHPDGGTAALVVVTQA